MRLVLKGEEREEERDEPQWRLLLFLVTHSLVTSKAGGQHSWWGGSAPISKQSTYCRGVEGSLVGTTWLLGNLSKEFEK